MAPKTFDYIVFIENIFCIYRNYVVFGNYKRLLVFLRILVELSIIIVHFFTYFMSFLNLSTPNHIYFTLDSITSLIYIIMPIINSRKFESFLKIVYTNSEYIGDNIYRRNIRKTQIKFIVAHIICLLLSAAVFTSTKIIKTIPTVGTNQYLFYIFQISLLMGEMRHVTEYILFAWVIYVIDKQLQCLMRSIGEHKVTFEDSNHEIEEHARRIEISEIDRWSNVYVNIKESSRISNRICGVQLCIMIATAILFYITVVYNMITQSLKGSGLSITDAFLRFGKLIILVFLLYKLSRNAQQAQNHATTLRRQLCRMAIAPFLSENEHKAMRDLVRLVTTRPIRAQAFGAVDINMTLLPVCLALFTSYTVIALQFNNVI